MIDTFHPLRKAYVHGDELEAAEDMAFSCFDLWRFPVMRYCTTRPSEDASLGLPANPCVEFEDARCGTTVGKFLVYG